MNYLVLILFMLNALNPTAHDFHMSKSDFHYKTQQNSIQMTVHIFIDDLELAISDNTSVELKLFSKNEAEASDSLINNYLLEQLLINLDGERMIPQYLGREMSDDLSGIWIYLEGSDLKPFKNCRIENRILLETFDDQQNIINLKVDNKLKAFHILDRKDRFKNIEI